MSTLITYFSQRHLLANLITLMVLVGGIIAWNVTNKEELPDITFNTVRISTSYPGASAEDVEFYVTKPLEEAVQGIDGLYKLTSSSGAGNSSISIELDRTITNIDEIVTEIKNQVASVQLPEDVLNDPRVRVFETSKKAIIDIAIYNEDIPLLDVASRSKLQNIARGLETKLLSQPEIFEVRRSGYLIEEIKINVNPKQFAFYEIPLNTIAQEIQRSHVRAPSGTLKSGRNEQVTVLSELDSKPKLDSLVIQGSFDSNPIKLNAIATITDAFEDKTTILKVNGREAIMFEVVKNSRYGILDALDVVRKVTTQYEQNVLSNTPIKLTFLDDESIDVRNRLSIITSNGLMGFVLIVITLFIFLNKRSGFWVAMGIPFTLCSTLIAGHFLGYTINGITLAGIIIVLGIVVDDAIIIAENISRRLNEGESLQDAAVNGTKEVIAPVIASVLTTCVAFVPLFFFSGRFGNFVKFIPPVIFMMLIASLFESFFLLPSHMTLFKKENESPSPGKIWFQKWENTYETLLNTVLPYRYAILIFFCMLMIGTGFLVKKEFKFVMFPDEESREIVLTGAVTEATSAQQTAQHIQPIEDYLRRYLNKEGIGIRTEVAKGRRGDAAVENQFSITLEITPVDKRQKSADTMIKEITAYTDTLPGLEKVRFRKNRFGQSSGSVFEIIVQENDDTKRDALVQNVVHALKQHPNIINVEEDVIPLRKEYVINFNQEQLKRLSVSPTTISSTLRTILNGKRLYTLFRNDEEIEVNLTVNDDYRTDIRHVLSVPVENNQHYLVPLNDIVTLEEINAKNVIRRQNMKRTSFIYADLSPTANQSPLEVAEAFENTIFPKLLSGHPTAQLSFAGEVIDTRESKQDLTRSIIAVVCLIYIVLAILFDSLIKPLRIMLVVPFGIIGVALAFYAHGKLLFGFYAAIGTLGMLGVVVNDAIVMLSKLDAAKYSEENKIAFTASIAKTRLRAIILTTLTTVVGVMPTAYGVGGTDTMLSDMMIALAWGLLFGTLITLILTPCFYLFERDLSQKISQWRPFSTIKGLTIVLFLILGAHPLQAAQERTLTLETFIQKALQHDKTFQSLLIDHLKLNYQKDLHVPANELLLNVASELTLETTDPTETTGIALTQTRPNWGQTYSATYSTEDTFTFSFSQDIAKNAFGKATALETLLQDIKIDIAKHQITEAYEDYMAKLMTLYYTWIRQYESLKLAKSSYAENEKVLQSILNRQKQKIADETDVSKLKLQILAKKEQVVRFERNYHETVQEIIRVIASQNNTTSLNPNSSIQLDPLPAPLPNAISHFQSTSRTSKILMQLQQQSTTAAQRLARDLLPSIQLSAEFTHTDSSEGTIGATFGLPFYQKKAKASVELAKLSEQQIQLDSQNTQDTLVAALQALHYALTTQKQLVDIAREKRTLASRILKNETENYSYGKITLNDYIDAVNRFDTTRFDEIEQEIVYQQLSIEWKRLTDTLVHNTNITQ